MNQRSSFADWLHEIVFSVHLRVPLLVVAFLVPVSFFSFLLFHTLAELISIIIATSAFIVAWNTHPFSRNNVLFFLGTGLLWLGALDLFHTLVFKGMTVYPGVSGGNLPTQFWIGTRYLTALILLAAPLATARVLDRRVVLAGLGACAVLLWLWIMSGAFPDAYIDGQGLTPFKIISEYIIIALFAAALLHMHHRRAEFDGRILKLIFASIVTSMVADLAFTFYVSVYGLSNLVGHLFKILANWYIYVALVEYALAEPFRLMAHAATTYDAIPQPTVVIDDDGLIRQTNSAARRLVGLDADQCIGRSCHELLHPQHLAIADCAACRQIRAGTPSEHIELEDPQQRRWTEITLSPVTWGSQTAGMVHVSQDITARKQAMLGLARSHTDLQRFAEVTAHHLQEPARRMASYAERLSALLAGKLDDPEAQLSLDFIGQQARYQQNLLRDVERYLAAHQPRGELALTDARQTVSALLARAQDRINAAGAKITVGELPPAWIDAPRLTDLFEIVLDNALQHGSAEKSALAGRQAAPLHITIEGECVSTLVRYRVSDNGPGIETNSVYRTP
jgi:PAS domain S-box-containing protein